jgi:pyruvyltransferase
MSKLIQKVTENLKLLFRPVLLNGFVVIENKAIRHENWGDDINYYFLREIIKRPILIYNGISLAFRLKLKNYLVIGSTIDMLCKENTEVWGAGIIYGEQVLKIKPKKVYAVRGPLTRKVLLNNGVDCPAVYGDPALLISKYYYPSIKKNYKFGIIPHIINIDYVKRMTVNGISICERDDFLVIDLGKYDGWKDIVDKVLSCETILSGSLHGLIISEAYTIPNLWIEFGEPLVGGHFKFHDFFLSIGRDRETSYVINGNELQIVDIQKELKLWQPGIIDLQPLIDSAPFPLKL